MVIAIYGSRRQQPYQEQLRRLFRTLVLDGATLALHPKLYNHLVAELGFADSGLMLAAGGAPPRDAALVLSIGGDGTFLRTAAWVGDAQTPVLGINTGTLGYLSALSLDEAIAHADEIAAGDFDIEERALLQVCAEGLKGSPFALNEVVVAKDDHTSILNIDARIDGRCLADYRADGLIVSTPTGSTAYNLSVGGPIVQPTAPVWVVSPMAAHSLGMRPLVVGDGARLSLVAAGRGKNFRLSVDGRTTLLPMGTQVTLKRAPYVTRIVMRHADGFPAVLRKKLLFN